MRVDIQIPTGLNIRMSKFRDLEQSTYLGLIIWFDLRHWFLLLCSDLYTSCQFLLELGLLFQIYHLIWVVLDDELVWAVDYFEPLHLVHSFLCFVLSMQLDLRSCKNRKCHTDIGTTWVIILYFWKLVFLFKHTDTSILKSF